MEGIMGRLMHFEKKKKPTCFGFRTVSNYNFSIVLERRLSALSIEQQKIDHLLHTMSGEVRGGKEINY